MTLCMCDEIPLGLTMGSSMALTKSEFWSIRKPEVCDMTPIGPAKRRAASIMTMLPGENEHRMAAGGI